MCRKRLAYFGGPRETAQLLAPEKRFLGRLISIGPMMREHAIRKRAKVVT